ncbi:MAG: hypothetical protein JW895_13875 [Thermoleophilaceae bacterium]|nr:hypothetical protein [Thermoleophilaceae bacterium]
MPRKREALIATFAVLAAAFAAACGSDGTGTRQASTGSGIGEARVATNGSGPGGDGAEVVPSEPPLDDLDDSGAVGAPGRSCSGTDLVPSGSNLGQVARSTLCLINAERRSRGLSVLRANRRLARAGLGHAQDMVTRSYFAHETRGGGGFTGRIKASGYMGGRRSWTVGENLAWGGGQTGTPRSIVTLWMGSPTHRANILDRRFREAGIGIALGAPVRGGRSMQAATYGNEFGVRGSR